MVGAGSTFVSIIALGIYLGSRFHQLEAGVFLGFGFGMSFLISLVREAQK